MKIKTTKKVPEINGASGFLITFGELKGAKGATLSQDKFKTNPFAKSYKSDLTQEVKVFHTGLPVAFFSKLAFLMMVFLAVGMIIGSLIR